MKSSHDKFWYYGERRESGCGARRPNLRSLAPLMGGGHRSAISLASLLNIFFGRDGAVRRPRCLTDFALVLLCVSAALGQDNLPASMVVTNPLVWDAMEKSAKTEQMNQNCLQVLGDQRCPAKASILHTESSCDCTVARMPSRPWILKRGRGRFSGRENELNGSSWPRGQGDLRGHIPRGAGPKVNADIPLTPAPFNVSARQRDMMAAQKDRQAVFRGSCAACHALPPRAGRGKCSSPKPARSVTSPIIAPQMVPDLAALKHLTYAAYWRRWITTERRAP